jgi:hypothetical protein
MSGNNAPPGGGPNGTVIASTAQLQQQNVPVVDDANKPVVLPAQTTPNVVATPDPNALNLEPVTQTNAAPAHTEVPDFGDNGLNIAADYFVNTLGLDINGRELTEAAKGNFALLEAKIEVLGDKAKGAGPILKLAQDSVNRIAESAKAQQAQTVTQVHAAVGGEANWKAVQQYARTNLPANQLKEASDALSSGGLAAVAMARHLLSLATTNPNVSTQGQAATDPNAVAESLQGVAPLTREQYRAEYKKLNQKYGINGVGKSAELAALNARFQA